MKITKQNIQDFKFGVKNINDDTLKFITFTPLRGMKSTNKFTVRKKWNIPIMNSY